MSKYGCPETLANGWHTGSLSIATKDALDIFKINQNTNMTLHLNIDRGKGEPTSVEKARGTYLKGPFWRNGFVLSFCTKSSQHPSNGQEWPSSVDVMYRNEYICPNGYIDGTDFLAKVPGVLAFNIDGVLPDITINRMENDTVLIKIPTCQRNVQATKSSRNISYGHFMVLTERGVCVSIADYANELEVITMQFNDNGVDISDEIKNEVTDKVFKTEYCFYRKLQPSDERVTPLFEVNPDIETLYQIPFSTRKKREVFVRSNLVYGVRIFMKFPVEPTDNHIVTDMYGIHSYTENRSVNHELDSFVCKSGFRIYIGGRCDGVLDCYDGEDELDCYFESKPMFAINGGEELYNKPWIMFKFPSMTAISSILIALQIKKGENPDIMVSKSEIINPGISISDSETGFWNHGDKLVDFVSFTFHKANMSYTDYFPGVNDTQYMIPHYEVEHRFKIPVMGQYLMVHFPQHNIPVAAEQTLESNYFNRMVGVHVLSANKVFMRECGELTQLKYHQLSASSSIIGYPANSSGLYNSGWCAEMTDSSPYIQIDLVFPALIYGITIKNWQIVEDFEQLTLGVNSFYIHHGFTETNLTSYGVNRFEVDVSQPYATIHRFRFHRLFYARYVRLIPVPLVEMTCIKFELITCGNKNDAPRSMNCSTDSHKIAVNTSTTFATFERPTSRRNVTSWTGCRDVCMALDPRCSVFEHRPDEQLCLVYIYNGTANMRTIRVDNDTNSTLTTHFCIEETLNTTIDDGQRQYKQTHGEGILTSLGYPQGYRSGRLTTWFVTVEESKYVRIHFTNISLNVYQDNLCNDTISISLSQFGRFYAEREGDVGPIEKTITSHNNGEALHYWGRTSYVYVTFETCEVAPQPRYNGQGFRALIRQADKSFCYGGWDVARRFKPRNCMLSQMQFASPTYLDSTPLILFDDVSMLYYVKIFAPARGNVRYIEIRFLDIEIPCSADYLQFSILDPGEPTNKKYCTFDQPPMIFRSTLWEVTIELFYNYYTYQIDYKENKWHGFLGSYQFVFNNETVYNWITSIEDSPTTWIPGSAHNLQPINRQVCTEKFRSCYTIYPTERNYVSRDSSQRKCERHRENLVSINTAEEYQFVRLMAENYTRLVQRYAIDYLYIRSQIWHEDFHIGLMRFRDGHTMRDLWLDGTPLLFSAWAFGEPSNVNENACTLMRLHSYRDDNTWYSQPCSRSGGSKAGYYICERPMGNKLSLPRSRDRLGSRYLNSIDDLDPMDIPVSAPFQCGSGEFLSWLSVCNGITECEDNGDEAECNQEKTCGNEEFQCNNGRCISYNQVCDNIWDCAEGEDETCELRGNFFECNNKQKIDIRHRCTGTMECLDGSDETDCGKCYKTGVIHCQAMDRNCVPESLQCDQYAECSNSADETECKQVSIGNCTNWWLLGNAESGVYNLGNEQVECDFRLTKKFSEIRTYIPFHLVMALNEDGYMYRDENKGRLIVQPFIEWYLRHSVSSCSIQIIESYIPARRMMLLQDDRLLGSDEEFSSVRFGNRDNLWFLSHDLRYGASNAKTTPPGRRLNFMPVICRNDFSPFSRYVPAIPCAGGLRSIPTEKLCLYDQRSYLDFGCRSLSHLWNCEDFKCPKNYVKCPDSFCLSWEFVCDGRKHCPQGEDEDNCHCKGDLPDVIVVILRTGAIDSRVAYRFTRQFLGETNRVNLFQLYDFRYKYNPGYPAEVETIQVGRERVMNIDYHLRSNVARDVDSYQIKAPNVLVDILQRHHGGNSNDLNNAMGSRNDQEKTVGSRNGLNNTVDNRNDFKNVVGSIMGGNHSQLNIIVLDASIYASADNKIDVWDIMFPLAQIPNGLNKPFRVKIDDSISGLVSKDEKTDRFVYKVQGFDFLEYDGSLIFDSVCKANKAGSCINKFQCEASRICIALIHVCDGIRQCPRGDDERICGVTCPRKCTCQGFVINCRNSNFTFADMHLTPRSARSLDLSLNPYLSDDTYQMLVYLYYLTKLNISTSRVKAIDSNSFARCKNTQVLDIRNNLIQSIPKHSFLFLESLTTLYLSGNKRLKHLGDQAFNGLRNIRSLIIEDTDIERLTTKPFRGLDLDLLDLSDNRKLRIVEDGTFEGLITKNLRLKNCPIKSFTIDIFTGISGVKEMTTSAYKFCCVRPPTVDESKCFPYMDEFSSCKDLMRDLSQRALLWVIGLVALIGNTLVILYRLLYDRSHLKLGYGIFVTSLAVSDFFMGLYLIIIAIADQVFRDRYIWLDDYWRNSSWCTFAGILSTVSSESSIMFMCLITIDRILVIKFPFGQIRFRPLSALVSVAVCLVVVMILSLVPIVYPDYFQNEFYSKSGVCIALPLTRERYPGWLYSVVIFVGLNFATFVLIAIGQLLIFQEVRKSSKKFKTGKSSRGNDLRIARNLLLVVSTDFLCWGPVGIMGLMSLAGSSIPPTVYAWTAVLILPVNSALNPFLYTLSAVMTKKTFKPRLEEQRVLGPESLRLLKKMLRFMNSDVVLKESDDAGGHSIEHILHMGAGDIGKVALQLALCMRLLHRRQMRLNDLKQGDVFILKDVKDKDRKVSVRVKVRPCLSSSRREKAEDIYRFGQILKFMLLRQLSD